MSYPDIEDDKFYDKINKIYKKYKIPKKKKSLKEICFPSKFELQIPQKFLSQYINPDTPYKGVLVYYKIGAGKTCTSIRIAEEWKNLKRIVVVVPASLKGNYRNELRSLCAGNNYLTQKERDALSKLHPTSKEYKNIIKISDARIDKYYEIYSYNKFVELAEKGKLNLKNSVLIIDEVQNMISEEGKFYEVLYNTIGKAPKDLRVVLMSATPMFNKPSEIGLIMNLLRIPFEFPVGNEFMKMFVKTMVNRKTGEFHFSAKNMDIFKERIKGYVSYFRGAPPYVFPEMKVRYINCEMSDFQYNAYMSVLKNEEKQMLSIKKKVSKTLSVDELPNNFFIGTRIVSNVVFPNKKIDETGVDSLKGTHVKNNLEKYSCKFAKVMKRIEKGSGKVFVYSSFKEYGGLKSFAKVLDESGYKNYLEHGEGKKRYAVWSGDEKATTKEEIKAVFNRKENLDGGKLKLILGSPSIREGISLMAVRQVHLLEPYWNESRQLQIIGRGVRFCSHKDMPEEKRNVKVYIYLATHPKIQETVDEYIYKLSAKKEKLVAEFEKALKEVAIDCELFKDANVYKDDANDIVCEK